MSGPLIVGSDLQLLLDVNHADAEACRAAIAPFAELERSPEHVHTYRISDLALWNAAALGLDGDAVEVALSSHARFPIAPAVLDHVRSVLGRWGRLVLRDDERHGLVLAADDPAVLAEVIDHRTVAPLLGPELDIGLLAVPSENRGLLKQALLGLGWPANDQAAHQPGQPLTVELDSDLDLRPYQQQAIAGFVAGGSGVIVLPCGAGKTLVGIGAMAELGVSTLVLVTNQQAASQWREELLRWTSLGPDDIGEYSGRRKETLPVTIATYPILATRRDGVYRHLGLLADHDWGLVIYDEVHLLPAGVFRLTADIQGRRRLGLTATLLREDGRVGDVFTLIGPKRFDAPWRDLELQGWISTATCTEVRLSLSEEERATYVATAIDRRPAVVAGFGDRSTVVKSLLDQHPDESALVIGTYVDPLEVVAAELELPIITGATPQREREELFAALRTGELQTLVVSKVANFSVDLPEVSVAVQVSGTFGSRQEEAQRLGRILRPKADGRPAHFYSLVARDTVEQDFAARRQRFLAEQGYGYEIVDAL